MYRYENITTSYINFLKNIYIHHKSQRYAFKIYTVNLVLYIETDRQRHYNDINRNMH